MEEMDLSDQHFKPCPCGYQVCRFCWHRIRENGSAACPACRRVYTEEGVEFTPVPPEVLAKASAKKRERREKREAAFTIVQQQQTSSQHGSSHPATTKSVDIISSRRAIADFRVIQRNLLYVIGISAKIASESVLRSHEFFGQYGPIVKLVVNRRNLSASSGSSSASAYITYQRAEDAAKAIAGIDGSVYDSRVIRATYGTTKYCSFYLRGLPCPNAGCMYLHEQGELVDSYTKEQLSVGNHHLHSFVVEGSDKKHRRFGSMAEVAPGTTANATSTVPAAEPLTSVADKTSSSPPMPKSLPPIVETEGFFERITRIMSPGGDKQQQEGGSSMLSLADLFASFRRSDDVLPRRPASPAPIGSSRPSSASSLSIQSKLQHAEDGSALVTGSSALGGTVWAPQSRSPSPPPTAVFANRSIDQFFSLFRDDTKPPTESATVSKETASLVSDRSPHEVGKLPPPPVPPVTPRITIAKREPVTIKTPDNKPMTIIKAKPAQATPAVQPIPGPVPAKVILKKDASTVTPSLQKVGTKNVFALLQDTAVSVDSSSSDDDQQLTEATQMVVTPPSKIVIPKFTTAGAKKSPTSPTTNPLPSTAVTDLSGEIQRLEYALTSNRVEVSQLETQLKQLMLRKK